MHFQYPKSACAAYACCFVRNDSTRSRPSRSTYSARPFTLLALSLVLSFPLFALSGATPPAPVVYAADVRAIIHPVSAEYMIQTIDRANAAHAAAVVFTLATPGGLVDSTRDIISRMLASKAPVVVFVGPSGARAASAGFLLTIAADVAVMAPGTHIGAAHPVAGAGETMDATMSKKAAEDVAAYARTLAGKRGRNTALADAAVKESRAFTDQEAVSATPPLVATVVVPDSVPPPGLVPMATVMLAVELVTVLPNASCTATCTAGESAAPAAVFAGCTVKASFDAPAALMSNVALLAPASTPEAAVRV